MADIKYTDSQLKAIKERDKNIIISAAAGSGKTRVLVDRVIDLVINDRVDIVRMIIVTFTNKASIEMKDRIREALEEKIAASPADTFLRNQLKLLKHAHIQTLHAFASDMLREYFYYFDNLSPSFSIISESTNILYKQEAIEEVFDEEYSKADPEFHNFIHNFSTSRNDKQAKDIVLATYEKTRSQVDPLGWLDKNTQNAFDFEILRENVRGKLEVILDGIRKNRAIVEEAGLRIEYHDLIADDYNLVNNLYKLIDNYWDDFIEKSAKAKFKTMVRARKDEKDIQPVIKSTRDLYKAELTDISKLVLNTSTDIVYEFGQKEARVLAELNRLTKLFINRYESKKQDKSYLDFNDMEARFIELLENPEANMILKERFKYIFFDEYQDSNEIQNYIIEKLKGADNLFFVGDVKQSIYGFRRAEPRLFIDKLEAYEDPSDDKSLRIDLNENFRTDRDILKFDNFIFDRLMTKESSGIDYKNGGHRLNATKEFETSSPKTEVHILDGSIDQANHIGKVIEKAIADGYEYRDIAILLRSGSRSYLYEEALKNADIPYFNDISKVSFGATEVAFFKNILKLIANPKDDLSLLAVLQSEIYNFSEDELALIRLDSEGLSFSDAFENYDSSDLILDKINDFKTEFQNYAYNLALMDLYEFGNLVFENSGFYEFLMARDRASDRIANVEAFIDLMAEYAANNDDGLYGFMEYADNLSLYKTDNINTSRDLSENENLVRIMTIHKSKGLEFPVVILAEASKRFNIQHLRENIAFDDRLGIGINVADYENKVKLSSIKRDLINEKTTIDNKREEMRVLYVAMTRAINKLIVVGDKNLKKLPELYAREDYLNMNTYMDWILAAVSTDKVACFIFDANFQTDDFDGEVSLDLVEEAEVYKPNHWVDINPLLADETYNEKLYDKFIDLYNTPYRFEADVNESIKKSVTEITKNFNPEEDGYELPSYYTFTPSTDFRKPSFVTDVREFKPTDIGTIIHKVFQALPYQNYDKKKLERALDRLVLENKIGKEELAVIENDKILAYFTDKTIVNLYKNATNIRKEESFLMKYEDFYINGQIDLIFELENEVVLLDFKTDAVRRPGFYDDQLRIYKRAIEESLGKVVTKSLIYWYNFNQIDEIN